MSKPRQKSVVCILFLIVMVSFILPSLLSKPSVFAQSSNKPQPKLQLSDNTNSTYPLSSVFNSLATDLKLNSSLLPGSSPISIANSMRNTNETPPIAGQRPYIAPSRDYVFSQNKSEISTPTNNSHTGEFGKGVKIAVVMPTFTAAAYDNAFYVFYQKYIKTRHEVNITADLNLLSSKVTNVPSSSASGFAMLYLLGNLKWIRPQSDVTFLIDQDVDAGSIFQVNGSNAYDVIILGHQE